MAYLRNGFTGTLLLILLIIISSGFALAEDVTFKVEIPLSIKQGDIFDIKVLLDIPSTIPIKQAEFVLTPSAGVTINSAVSGELLSGATVTYNQKEGSGFHYGETTTGTEISGTNKLFVTLKATAVSASDVTLTFSGLVAKKGNFARTVTSVTKTITVTPSKKEVGEICNSDAECNSGACYLSYSSEYQTKACAVQKCVDPDSDNPLSQQTAVTDKFGKSTILDYCHDINTMVYEWSCDDKGDSSGKYENCPAGMSCKVGACANFPCTDNDGDSYGINCALGLDCNDNNFNINPGMEDTVCDGIDNNCSNQIDEGYVPTYECGEGVCLAQSKCVNGQEECTPGTPSEEICADGLDNDCDGFADADDIDCSPPLEESECTPSCESDTVCITGECKLLSEVCPPNQEYDTTYALCYLIGDLDQNGKVNEEDVGHSSFKQKVGSMFNDLSKLNKFLWAFKHNYVPEVGQ